MFTHHRQHGFALLWVAITMMALVGFAGLAIDTVYSVSVARELQTAADAAALAGANSILASPTSSAQTALNAALANKVAKTSVHLLASDVVLGIYNRTTSTFTATTTAPNAIQVTARRTSGSTDGRVPLLFGPMFGANTVGITRSAIAMAQVNNAAGMVVLNLNAPKALELTGSASINLSLGPIRVNSSASNALSMTGSATVFHNVDVKGGYSMSGSAAILGTITTGVPAMADPLASLPAPSYNPLLDKGTINASGFLPVIAQPGYYSGGIKASGSVALTLLPGTYVLAGQGLQLSAATSLVATGVTIHILPGSQSLLKLTGSGAAALTPPSSGTYAGVSIFQARTNTNAATITGGGLLNLLGTLYFPNNHLGFTGSATGNVLGTQVIADTVTMTGNAEVNINFNYNSPGITTGVFLVR